jgi:hypothetical protein
MVEISLDVPERIYDKLTKLSETYSQDVEETVNQVLDAVCFDRMWLVESKKVETIARGLRYKIARRLDSGKMADHSLFEKILKELNAESHFGAGDMEIDLDDDSIWINYEGLIGSNLFVDSFDITFSGLKSLTADCLVEVDEDDDGTLGQVEEHARRIKRTLEELSEEFRDLDPWEIFVLAQDEASICLRIHFSEESLGSLPSIPAISEFFENVLASAGVSRSL